MSSPENNPPNPNGAPGNPSRTVRVTIPPPPLSAAPSPLAAAPPAPKAAAGPSPRATVPSDAEVRIPTNLPPTAPEPVYRPGRAVPTETKPIGSADAGPEVGKPQLRVSDLKLESAPTLPKAA